MWSIGPDTGYSETALAVSVPFDLRTDGGQTGSSRRRMQTVCRDLSWSCRLNDHQHGGLYGKHTDAHSRGLPLQMSSGPFVKFKFPTRTDCAFGAVTRYITRLSGKTQGYLASGMFNALGLQSGGACPQHSPAAPSANKISVDFMSSPLEKSAQRRPRRTMPPRLRRIAPSAVGVAYGHSAVNRS